MEEALAHPYLSTLHHEDDEPSAEQPFKFQFKQTDLTKKRLQELMYEHTSVPSVMTFSGMRFG